MTEESCLYCRAMSGKEKLELVYEDKKMVAVMHPEPAVLGHMVVFPKKHTPILETLPDYELGDLFLVASKLSVAVFESLGVQGTNIILQNGTSAGQTVPHVALHIIPRVENDGMNFQWQPKQLSQEEMSTVELQLKEACEGIGEFEKKEATLPIKIEKKIEKIKDKAKNYIMKQIERIP